jgi:hypothetical protein
VAPASARDRLDTGQVGPCLFTRGQRARRGSRVTAMTAFISHTSLDCRDAYAQSVFWGAVLGFAGDPDHPDETGDEGCMVFSADGAQRLQTGRNRMGRACGPGRQ